MATLPGSKVEPLSGPLVALVEGLELRKALAEATGDFTMQISRQADLNRRGAQFRNRMRYAP